MAVKRRRLQDLYVMGCEAKITGPEGEEVVWLQKLNTTDEEAVLRRANAARAKVLMLRNDKESEEYQSAYSDVSDFEQRDILLNYLIQEELAELRMSRDAELAAEEEWSKDNYLQGLRDAWEGTDEDRGLKHLWMENPDDPEDPEATRVYNEIKRFTSTVDKQMEPEEDLLKRSYENVSDEDLIHKVVALFLESKANKAWMKEHTRSELFYATRCADNHSKRYFERKEEIDDLPPPIFAQIAAAYGKLKIDPLEGKGSAETDISLLSSAPPEPEGMADSSGLQSVSQ